MTCQAYLGARICRCEGRDRVGGKLGMLLLVCSVASGAASAHAEGTTVQAETGLEYDSNVTLATANADPIAAMVLRGAGLAAGRFSHGRHRFTFDLVGRLRAALDPSLASEVVGLGAVDLRWLYQPGTGGEGNLDVGAHASLSDARGLAGVLGARTFRNANAEGVISLRQNAHRFIVAVGGRDFAYRPNARQSYRGGAATTALESRLWQSADQETALTLTLTAGYELRRFDGKAQTSLCPPAMLRPECVRDTTVARNDQVRRAGAELTYTGGFILGGTYRLLDITSTSFGQSLRRHQFSVAATRELSTKLFATVGATAQLDEFSAGAKLVVDPLNPEISTLADEARSMVQLRLGYRMGPRWTLEVRAATWTNLASDVAYHRRTFGVTLVRD